MKYQWKMLVLAMALWFGARSTGWAGTTGKIAGVVKDKETGEPLPAVNVVLVGTTLGAATGLNGEYFILNVPPGTHEVKASMVGYTEVIEKNVRVFADLTTTVNFELSSRVLELGRVVEVIAERPLIQKDVTATTKITTNDEIVALPVTTFQGALAIAPGTQGSGNNLHIRGGRAGEIAYLIDGLSVEDPQVRGYGMNVGREALSEMQVLSGGFNAEYGNAQSGVVLLSTKEGNPNRFSGKVWYTTDAIAGHGITSSSQNFDWYEASLGGPEPLTQYLLPALGVQVPGNVSFFLQGEARFNDRASFHPDALKEAHESARLRTSDRLRNTTFLEELLGIGGRRENVVNNVNAKLTYQITPNHKLTIGWRGNFDDLHGWTFTHGGNLGEIVAKAQALGINDGRDNDGDGRIDEEIFNSVDDDGDGVIDERDGVLERPDRIRAGSGLELSWGVDSDRDGRVDEEAFNGLDDDGDGRIDEDLQPYPYNGYDHIWRTEQRGNQLALTWTHALSKNTFYEVRLGRFNTFTGRIPKIGKDGTSRSSFEELESWLQDYEAALKEIERIRKLREQDPSIEVPNIQDLIEPYLGFGDASEPWKDANQNGRPDPGEFTDWNGNGLWDRNNPDNNRMQFIGENHPFRGLVYRGTFWASDRAGFSKRESTTWSLKFDITSQINPHHQIKGGVEGNYFDLFNISRQITNPYNGRGLFANEYHVFPNWEAAYLQDKMEYKSAIVNIGLRVERFDQGDQVAVQDTSSPVIPRLLKRDPQTGQYLPPEAKWSLLPRIGFSFPVTDRDVFYFSYGRFFQRPQLVNVFNQVNQPIDSPNSIVGNPLLDPEETIQYEFGIRHQFGLNTLLSITGFFKDIDNLLQINKEFDDVGNVFRTYFNDTYGTVKGLEILLSQRAGRVFSGEASYTFQVANTTHSSARSTYTVENIFEQLGGKEFPADWDQRHALIVNLDYHYGENSGPRIGTWHLLENWNVNVLSTLESGLPYTPEDAGATPLYERTNTERFPWTWNVDLRTRRFFRLGSLRMGLVLEVLNLFNRRNALGPDDGGLIDAYTGRLWRERGIDRAGVIPTQDRIGFDNASSPSSVRNHGGFKNSVPDPSAWGAGRRIRIGATIEF